MVTLSLVGVVVSYIALLHAARRTMAAAVVFLHDFAHVCSGPTVDPGYLWPTPLK